jgi:two-component system cell cycle sensor histidine kinase/response regulator CckA
MDRARIAPPDGDDPEPSAPAEALRADLQACFDATFETSATAMGIISCVENRYVRANQPLADLLGMTREEVLASDPYVLAQATTHPDDLVAEQKLFAELAVGARRTYRLEKRFLRPDGTSRWGVLTFTGIHGEPATPSSSARPLRFAVIQVVETTERRALEETLQRRESELQHAQKVDGIGRLAAGIAHDFNNLLTVIMGHAEIVKALTRAGTPVPRDPEVAASLDAILAASQRAASLTAQVLAHGRRERIARRSFVLSEAVGSLQRLLGLTIGAHAHIRVEQSLNAKGAILADQGQVSQVVMNLILNARDALAEGGQIVVATRDLVVDGDAERSGPPGPGAWVVLTISDDGHGMSPETRAQIFEPFFTTRADRPGTQGSGLGLATVYRIVSELGGCIDIESAPGHGTAVTIYFPRATLAVPVAQEPQHPPRAPNSRRVLVIEDEPSVRSLVAGVLLGAHHRVMVARNGEEALRLLETEQTPFDLVVTDLMMPSVGGLAVAQRLQENAKPPRMLFISGYNNHPPSELAAFGRFLPKPFSPAQLLEAVDEAFDEAFDEASGPA